MDVSLFDEDVDEVIELLEPLLVLEEFVGVSFVCMKNTSSKTT